MDVVIAIFGDTLAELAGLRKSVDSLKKFGEGLDRIVVVGRIPRWLEEGEVKVEGEGEGEGGGRETASVQQQGGMIRIEKFRVPPMRCGIAKHDLVVDGLLKAIKEGVVCGEFLYCPLGVTLEGPTDLANYPRYCRRGRIRSIAEMVAAGKGGAVITKYWLAVTDARQLLERNGFSAIDFSGKFLAHMNAEDMMDVEALWVQEPHAAFGYEPACLFGNIRESKVAAETPRWVEWGGC